MDLSNIFLEISYDKFEDEQSVAAYYVRNNVYYKILGNEYNFYHAKIDLAVIQDKEELETDILNRIFECMETIFPSEVKQFVLIDQPRSIRKNGCVLESENSNIQNSVYVYYDPEFSPLDKEGKLHSIIERIITGEKVIIEKGE